MGIHYDEEELRVYCLRGNESGFDVNKGECYDHKNIIFIASYSQGPQAMLSRYPSSLKEISSPKFEGQVPKESAPVK